MSVTVYAKNLMLDHLSNGAPMYVGAFDGDSELQLNGRKKLQFSEAAEEGRVVGVVEDNLTIPAGKTVFTIKVWDKKVSGNLIMSYDLTIPEVYSNEGALVVNSITLTLD
ncbi:hypothetical protein NVP1161O_031 [Vibrio phage 1.161.O._10N.261.48.C5]|nr:hypothetical protein NVP1161O_031 [Vibrio phage 1.161.O._10N.261.48.C5]